MLFQLWWTEFTSATNAVILEFHCGQIIGTAAHSETQRWTCAHTYSITFTLHALLHCCMATKRAGNAYFNCGGWSLLQQLRSYYQCFIVDKLRGGGRQ